MIETRNGCRAGSFVQLVIKIAASFDNRPCIYFTSRENARFSRMAVSIGLRGEEPQVLFVRFASLGLEVTYAHAVTRQCSIPLGSTNSLRSPSAE